MRTPAAVSALTFSAAVPAPPSTIAPACPIRFPGGVPGAIGHHWSNVACTYGSAAHKGLNVGAKAMAASALDLIKFPAELKKLRDEFDEYQKEHPYQSFLPGEARPPLNFNKQLMDKWRQMMDKSD